MSRSSIQRSKSVIFERASDKVWLWCWWKKKEEEEEEEDDDDESFLEERR